MNILHEDTPTKGKFYTDNHLAHIEYNYFSAKGIIIEHTEVDKSLAGQGIGKQLVAAVVLWARANEIKVIPLCPYAKAMFEKEKGYADVWYQS